MYEELVSLLRKKYDNAPMVMEAADAIEELDFACSRYEKDYKALCAYLPKWIPVTERLPEMYQPVLTFDGQCQTVEMRVPYILDGDGEQIESDWWVDADNDINAEYYRGLRDGAANYWMPLPEPPREENDD